MTDANEYEVEAVLEARVEKKRGKKALWKYHVKWKGYSHEENTWEPAKSFQGGSQHFLREFWASVNLQGRDPGNLSLFANGESFVSVEKPETADQEEIEPPPSSLTEVAEQEPVAQSSTRIKGSSKRSRNISPESQMPIKRTRNHGNITHSTSGSTKKRKSSVGGLPELLANQSNTCGKAPKRGRRRASSEAADSEAEMTQDSSSTARLPEKSQLEAVSGNQNDGCLDNSTDNRSVEIANGSDPEHSIIGESPSLIHALIRNDSAMPLPSHRSRAAQPLVKMLDDPRIGSMDGAISVKTRLVRQIASSTVRGTSARGEESSTASNIEQLVGLPSRKSSLLTFDKGGLKTLRRKHSAFSTLPSTSTLTPTSLALHETDSSTWSQEVNTGDRLSQIPTEEELLELAGYNAEDAAALPDFEDDAPPEEPNSQDVSVTQSLAIVKEQLLPSNTFSTTNLGMTWKHSTIFGPLGLGADLLPGVTTPAPASPGRPAFVLNLDYYATLPVVLKDITPHISKLGAIVSQSPLGPPGKFYKGESAVSMLDTLKPAGCTARVCLDLDADEKHQQNFEKFALRLRTGELFIAMAGAEVVAFCSSENVVVGQRLEVPQYCLGLVGTVLISRVVIQDHSAFADVAIQADRW